MTNTFNIARKALRSGTALQALALLGAGVGITAIAAPAVAQDYSQVNTTGRVQGTDGKPIQGATVTVTSNDQGFTRTVTTGSDGQFQVPSLPQGSYTFSIEASGYDSFTDNGVTLSQGGAANQFTLAAAGAAAGGDIVVTAGRVQTVDFTQNTTGAVINVGELATRVPVARDLTSVVLLAPGTTQGDSAFGNLPSVAGSSISENTYYINGLNITNFRNGIGSVTVPFDFYQTVEVKNGGYSAEFGRATGGFINATSKSGSNEFHGGVTFNWEPDDLSSKSPRTYASDNDSAFNERKDFIAQLSGPIIKDHLFFYGLYQSRDVQSAGGSTGTATALSPFINPLTGVAVTPTAQTIANSCFSNPQYCQSFPSLPSGSGGGAGTVASPFTYNTNLTTVGTLYTASRGRSPFYGAKIDAVIVDGQRLEFTYFNTTATTYTNYYGNSFFTLASGGRYNPNNNNPGLAVPANVGGTLVNKSGGENYVARYTGNFTDWFTLSATYGRNNNTGIQTSSGANFPAISDQRFAAATSIGNPVAGAIIQNDKRDFYRADADVFVKLFGDHHFRFGYDREDLDAESATTYNGQYQYLYTATYIRRRYFQNGGKFNTKSEAFYGEDNWQLFNKRLTLNLGIRDDRFINKNNLGQAFFNSGDNFAPRVGFSADPTGDGRTKVYGSFSRYYLGIPANTNTRLAGPELDYYQYYNYVGSNANINADNTPILGTPRNSGNGQGPCPRRTIDTSNGATANCIINQNGEQPVFSTLVSSSLTAQSVDEYILGFEHRLGRRIKFGAYYTQRNLRQSLEDAYVDAGVQGYCKRNNLALTNTSGTGCADIFTGASQYSLINPGENNTITLNRPILGEATARTITITPADFGLPHAKRDYKSMTLTADREFDGVWSLSASYTISALVGNIEGGIRSDNGQSDSGLTTNFDLPALVNGIYGYLPQHRRHNVKVYGSYQLFKFLNLGANLQVTSPRKFGCLGVPPNYVDGGLVGNGYGAEGFYCNVVNGKVQVIGAANNPASPGGTAPAGTLALTPRGSVFQSDWLYNLGIDAAFKIPTDAFDATLRVSVFNVLNQKAGLDYQEVGTLAEPGAPNPVYGQVTSYQTPRYVRLQLGINF